MSELIPIQWLRYNLGIRNSQGGLVSGVYKYQGYIQDKIMPRGADPRHIELEKRRREQKVADNVSIIQDRPLQ